MPASKKQTQTQKQPHPEEDTVAECVKMYPVFCTSNIPSEVLDEFIDEAYRGWFDMLAGDMSASGASPCILQTTDLDSITHGSRTPMPADFTSPFLNMTDSQIREWMTTHICRPEHPNFAQSTFTILDHNAVEHKMSRMGYIGEESDPDERMLWADFHSDLYIRVPIEMCTVGWESEVALAEIKGGNEQVRTVKVTVEESDRAYARERGE